MDGKWTTVSSYTESVEDSNPAIWYNAAKNATSYESAMLYYEKAERYYKNDKSGYIKEWFLKEKLYYKFHKKKVHIVLLTIVLTIIAIFCSLIYSEYKRREEIAEAKRIRIEENRKARENREREIEHQKWLAKKAETENRMSLFNDFINNKKEDFYEAAFDYAELKNSNFVRVYGKGLITDAKIENGKRYFKVVDRERYDSHWLSIDEVGLSINYNKIFKKMEIGDIQKNLDFINEYEKILFYYNDLAYSIIQGNAKNQTEKEIQDIIKILKSNAENAEKLEKEIKNKAADDRILSYIIEDLLSSHNKMSFACNELAKLYDDRIKYIISQSSITDNDRYYYRQFRDNVLSGYKYVRDRLNKRISENYKHIKLINKTQPDINTEKVAKNKALKSLETSNKSTPATLVRYNPKDTFLLFVQAINERRLEDAKKMFAPNVKDHQFFEFLVAKNIKILELNENYVTATNAVYTIKAKTTVQGSNLGLRGKVELVKINNIWYLNHSKF